MLRYYQFGMNTPEISATCKMPEKYTDMILIYGKVNKNGLAAVQEYRDTFHIEEHLIAKHLKLWRDDLEKLVALNRSE
ncbi:hypothetical protein J6590_105028 [Homalodisca vitripennis]|nr:hypothetical protein J6590_105028 [Homalodisca vitripennis]